MRKLSWSAPVLQTWQKKRLRAGDDSLVGHKNMATAQPCKDLCGFSAQRGGAGLKASF